MKRTSEFALDTEDIEIKMGEGRLLSDEFRSKAALKQAAKSFASVCRFLVTFLLGIAILSGDDPASDSFDLP